MLYVLEVTWSLPNSNQHVPFLTFSFFGGGQGVPTSQKDFSVSSDNGRDTGLLRAEFDLLN